MKISTEQVYFLLSNENVNTVPTSLGEDAFAQLTKKVGFCKSEIIHDFNCLPKFDKPQQLCLSRIGFVSQSLS